MASLEQMAQAALSGDALALRALTQDWLRENPRLAECPRPATAEPTLLAVAASLVELLAQRAGQAAPAWTANIAGLPEVRYLLRSAATMKRLRRLCDEESPAPLRRRNLFAPADYLTFA
jgi:hypothetical protein